MTTPNYVGGSEAMSSPYFLGKRRRIVESSASTVTGLTNPLQNDMDVNNFDIINTSNIEVTNINDTAAPIFVGNIGPLVPNSFYEIAKIVDPATAKGNLTVHLSCNDSSFQQKIIFEVCVLPGKTAIFVKEHLVESDTFAIDRIVYGEIGAINSLAFRCNNVHTECTVSIYENYVNSGPTTCFVPTTTPTVITFSQITQTYVLTDNEGGTTQNFNVLQTATSKNLKTNTIDTNTSAAMDILTDVNFTTNSLTNANVLQSTSVSTSTIGNGTNDLVVDSQIDFKNNKLTNSLNDYVYINENLDLLGNGIQNASSIDNSTGTQITCNTNLNLDGNRLVDVDNVETNSISKNSGTILFNNPVDLQAFSIKSSFAPSANSDLTNKQYVDSAVSAGGLTNPLTVDLDLGTNSIVNVATGVATNDACTVGQLNASTQFESLTTNNISNKNSGNVGIGVTNPVKKLDVDGDIQSSNIVSALKGEVDNLDVNQVISVNNTMTNAQGLSRFMTRGISAPNVFKRIATFSHVFTNATLFTVRVPDFVFEPRQTNFLHGGAAFKVKLSAMGFEDGANAQVTGGIEYKEIIFQHIPMPLQGGASMSSFTHTVVNVNCAPASLPFTSYIQLIQLSQKNIQSQGQSVRVNDDAEFGFDIYPEPGEVPGANNLRKLFIRGSIEAL